MTNFSQNQRHGSRTSIQELLHGQPLGLKSSFSQPESWSYNTKQK